MSKIDAARKRIQTAKASLITQARSTGLSENFGQAQVSKLQNHKDCNAFGTPEQRAVHAMVNDFENWCLSLDISQLK